MSSKNESIAVHGGHRPEDCPAVVEELGRALLENFKTKAESVLADHGISVDDLWVRFMAAKHHGAFGIRGSEPAGFVAALSELWPRQVWGEPVPGVGEQDLDDPERIEQFRRQTHAGFEGETLVAGDELIDLPALLAYLESRWE